ncbi:MAG: hypothetical protein AAF602_17955 [Myxococcota bacterium]
MRRPTFDADGSDGSTYAPWHLWDRGHDPILPHSPRYVLSLDVEWAFALTGVDEQGYYTVGLPPPGHYMNGEGLAHIAMSALIEAGLRGDELTSNCEADACILEGHALDDVAKASTVLSDTFRLRTAFHRAVLCARGDGREDA